MKLHRVHTKVSVIDEDTNKLLTLETFNHMSWSLYDQDNAFHFTFEAKNYEQARAKAKIIYYNYLLVTKQIK